METSKTSGLDRKIADSHKDIEGWGIDANPQNNPTYPMKRYTGADHDRLKYDRAPQQPVNVEILQSIERPEITRVFGATLPPKGVSGMLRRYAFRFGEGSSVHWMTLMLADRVDVVEGVLDDLKRGHIPNFLAERGWKAEWKYNRKGVVKNVVVGIAVTSAVVAWFAFRNKDKRVGS